MPPRGGSLCLNPVAVHVSEQAKCRWKQLLFPGFRLADDTGCARGSQWVNTGFESYGPGEICAVKGCSPEIRIGKVCPDKVRVVKVRATEDRRSVSSHRVAAWPLEALGAPIWGVDCDVPDL